MNLSEPEEIIDIAKDKFRFPDYQISLTGDNSRFRKNEAATIDYDARKIFVRNDPSLNLSYVTTGLLWCCTQADFSRGREGDERHTSNVGASRTLYGVTLELEDVLRRQHYDKFEKIDVIDFAKIRQRMLDFLDQEQNVDIKFGFRGMARKIDEFNHLSAYTGVRIRSTENRPVDFDSELKTTLQLDCSEIVSFLLSKSYPVIKRIIPAFEDVRPYVEIAKRNVRDDLQGRFYFGPLELIYTKLAPEQSPVDKDLKELISRSFQIVSGMDLDETLKDKPEEKKIVVNTLERLGSSIWLLEHESQMTIVQDKPKL